MGSCYAHVVALATKAFLTALSPKGKSASSGADDVALVVESERLTEPTPVEPLSIEDTLAQDESEETEGEVMQLLDSVTEQNPTTTLDMDLKKLQTLILNCRGFVAKVIDAEFLQFVII